MRFDPSKWQEVNPNETYQNQTGRLHVMCSDPSAALYLTGQGVEALAGVGAKIDVSSADFETFKVVAPEAARVFLFMPVRLPYEPAGEVFTNIDRKPMESGSMLEVTRAIRSFKLDIRKQQIQLAQERRELERLRNTEPEAEVEPDLQESPEETTETEEADKP